MPTDGHGQINRQNRDKYLFFVDVYGRERTLTEFGMVPLAGPKPALHSFS